MRDAVKDSTVLDIYSGTGSLGIEALSRGAAKAVFIDNDKEAQSILQKNLTKAGFLDFAEMITLPAKRGLRKLARLQLKFDIILADPPYGENLASEIIHLVERYDLLSPFGWLTVEHNDKSNLLDIAKKYSLKSQKRLGETRISFFQYA